MRSALKWLLSVGKAQFSSLTEMDFFFSCRAPETRCVTLIAFSDIQFPLMSAVPYFVTKTCFCTVNKLKT